MQPITPVIPGVEMPVVKFAETQDQYQTLPALELNDENGTVISRWRLTWFERFQIFCTGNLWLTVWKFDQLLQPVKLSTTCPVLTSEGRLTSEEGGYAHGQ